jgi:hypothetical protein
MAYRSSLALLLPFVITTVVVGDPPFNDECSHAWCIDAPWSGGPTIGATGQDVTSCAFNDANDVWLSYTPVASGAVTISTCNEGTDFDTTLAVFDGCGGVELACNDDFCGFQSQVTVNMTAGTRYLIRVAGYNGATGQYAVTVDVPALPCGEECNSCFSYPGGGVWIAWESTWNSTGSTGDDTSCTFNDTIDEWFSYTANCTGFVTATTCAAGFYYSTFDTSLAVFDTCGGSELDCNDDFCSVQSMIEWYAIEGQSYYIRVSGYNGATGSYALLVVCAARHVQRRQHQRHADRGRGAVHVQQHPCDLGRPRSRRVRRQSRYRPGCLVLVDGQRHRPVPRQHVSSNGGRHEDRRLRGDGPVSAARCGASRLR